MVKPLELYRRVPWLQKREHRESPNVRHHWRRPKDVRSDLRMHRRRPVHVRGWTSGSLPYLVRQWQSSLWVRRYQTKFHNIAEILNISVIPEIPEVVNPS